MNKSGLIVDFFSNRLEMLPKRKR